jgi:hypothetical protein
MDFSDMPPGSISFVIVTENGIHHADVVIDAIAELRRDTDEVILLARSDQTAHLPGPPRQWLRVVGMPDANIFTLRAQIPAVAKREWVLLLEEHAFITKAMVGAIRSVIEGSTNVDLIPILGKNLQSTSNWSWASFLHSFGTIWAPLDGRPTYCNTTSVAVRRAALGSDAALSEGQWEFRIIPGIFATGNIDYSNEIYIDHFKPLDLVSCFILNFHNGRASGALMCRVGKTASRVRRSGWRTFARRPATQMRAIGERKSELPRGMIWRLRVVGLAHGLGMVAGSLFGPGRSVHRLD